MAQIEKGSTSIKKFKELCNYECFVFMKDLHEPNANVNVYIKTHNGSAQRMDNGADTFCHPESFVVPVTCTRFKIKA